MSVPLDCMIVKMGSVVTTLQVHSDVFASHHAALVIPSMPTYKHVKVGRQIFKGTAAGFMKR